MKWTELRQLSDSALQSKLEELSEEVRNMRFQGAIGPLENPLLMRNARRKIARIRTLLQEKAAGSKVEKK